MGGDERELLVTVESTNEHSNEALQRVRKLMMTAGGDAETKMETGDREGRHLLIVFEWDHVKKGLLQLCE